MSEKGAASASEVGLGPDDAELCQIDALLPTVYSELRGLAEAILQRCQPIDSACTTSLIHDVYVRLSDRGVQFKDRSHFLCVAARAMRFVLIDRVRRAGEAKRRGGQSGFVVGDSIAPAVDNVSIMAVDEALARLAAFDERKSRIIELRFFGGLSLEETAEVLSISQATIKREWTLARAWLYRELGDGEKQPN